MSIFKQAVTFWGSHGTKALGSVATFLASAQTAALVMNPSPLDPKQMAWLAGANAFVGAWTVKRGFSNSAQPSPAP